MGEKNLGAPARRKWAAVIFSLSVAELDHQFFRFDTLRHGLYILRRLRTFPVYNSHRGQKSPQPDTSAALHRNSWLIHERKLEGSGKKRRAYGNNIRQTAEHHGGAFVC